jgi:2-keto-4-pentenoate hydratase/2-oxohepta-3-ene-1,7-dioic acid hydratase in catechol pathway
VTVEAPVLRPPKYLAIGLNYVDHVKESGMGAPAFPVLFNKQSTCFNKQSTCVVGTGRPIHRPRVSALLDYEGELAFVIGRRCRHVPRLALRPPRPRGAAREGPWTTRLAHLTRGL